MAATKNLALSIDDAWNSVALEERLELISRAQADGILAACAAVLLVGTIAYGFDEIYLLLAGLALGPFVFSLFSSYSWRRGRPALILAYLAVRTVARRYGYGYNLPDLDIVLIYRGRMREVFATKEDAAISRQLHNTESETAAEDKAVWICLLRGGIILLSEKPGGAKLEFITAVTPELVCERFDSDNELPDSTLVIEGTGSSRGRKVLVWSSSIGAQYVFERRVQALVDEASATVERLEKLRRKEGEEKQATASR